MPGLRDTLASSPGTARRSAASWPADGRPSDGTWASTTRDRGADVLVADPSDEATLERARLGEAPAVVVATDEDAEDALVALTARHLNPEVTIVAAATNRENVAKLRRAGADTVISPATIGGHLLVEFVLGGDVDIEEVAGELAGDG
ncbi:MAG: NAD(P)-binding protein [Halobacteriales archaeon]